ncbi:Asp domain-containing protein [Cephalotus follicularis]|uniref:Asp domain-containing protein n=1 Tax=Cephalotus follicularis TaxID=3775 RepID=A0A1Q3CBI3_CEPFO|nr:Asp domain-containing protein [Cephalotus follicularis]
MALSFRFLFSSSLLLLSLLCASNKGGAHRYLKPKPNNVIDGRPNLNVYHKAKLCPPHDHPGTHKAYVPSHEEILRLDQDRVDSIHSKISNSNAIAKDSTTLPAKSGAILNSGNYFVTIGLGTPKKELSLIFDTGSFLAWTQCEPCSGSCYRQQEPIFDPSASTSYNNITCNSATCQSSSSATGTQPGCSDSTCTYATAYGDGSATAGFLGNDALTLTDTDIVSNFVFGCGENNTGLFHGTAGLLGLGRDPLSIVSQTAQEYNQVFSYCLPSTASLTGSLTFGSPLASQSFSYTPLSSNQQTTSFYGLDTKGITVNGTTVNIDPSVWSTAGTIIDSGTVITRLPPDAYSAMRDAFKQGMTQYPTAPPYGSFFDTCYDLSEYPNATLPVISLLFNGSVTVPVPVSGTLYQIQNNQSCLAFAPNGSPNDVAIYGNQQQLTIGVVYDVPGNQVGFANNVCQ